MKINSYDNNSIAFKTLKVNKIYQWKQQELDSLFEKSKIPSFAQTLDRLGFDTIAKKIDYTEINYFGLSKKTQHGLELTITKKDDKAFYPISLTLLKPLSKVLENFNSLNAMKDFKQILVSRK